MISIIAIGKKHEPWITTGIERYESRLKKPWSTKWVLMTHSSLEGARARQEESVHILSRVGDDDFVVLLDEKGKLLDSPGLSRVIEQQLDASRNVICVIGGAYGVDETLRQRADIVWSLSPLVFPHQLVRLILCEQLYRAQEIAYNRPYHHS